MTTPTLTFRKARALKGSRMIAVNVDRNGKPFAQIYTFKAVRGELHPWHAAHNGNVTPFYGVDGGFEAAKAHIIALANG